MYTYTHTNTENGTQEAEKPWVTSTASPEFMFRGGPENHRAVPQVSRHSERTVTPKVSVTGRASSPVGDQHGGETEGGRRYDLYKGEGECVRECMVCYRCHMR